MKAGERDVAAALRMLVSELQKDVKEGAGDELAVVRREHKRRLEAATQFEKANRPDLVHKEQAEAAMIARYLPPDLTDQQLDEIIAEAIAETGATGPRDMGPVMKVVKDRAGGLVMRAAGESQRGRDGKGAQEMVALSRMFAHDACSHQIESTGKL